MTNKLLKINIMIIFSVISISMALYLKKINTDEIALNRYNIADEFTSIQLPNTPNGINELEVQDILKTVSKDLGINYLKRVTDHTAKKEANGEYNEGVDVVEVNYYVYTVKPTQLLKRFSRSPDNIHNKQLTEFENSSSEIVFSINNIEKDSQGTGTYYLETTNENELKNYLESVAKTYNKNFGTNLKPVAFINTNNEEKISFTTFRYLQNLIVYSVTFLLIALMLWFLCNTHKISIFFLHGSSSMHIFVKTFFYEILFITIGLITFIPLFLFKSFNGAYVCFQLIIAISFFIVSYITISIAKSLSLTKQLNKKLYTSKFLPTIYIVKVFLLAISLTLFLPLAELFISASEKSSDSTIDNYGVFYPAYVGEDLRELQNGRGDSYGISDEILYNYLEEQGSLLIDTANYYEQQTELDRNITVNPNYLEQYPIISAKGQPIVIDTLNTEKIVLIPERFIDSYSEIQELYTNIYGSETGSENIAYYLIKDDQKIFTFQSEEPFIVRPNIIEVQTQNNSLSNKRVFITGSGETDPIKIKIENSPEETYEDIYPYLNMVGRADNYIALTSVKDVSKVNLRIQIGRINRYLLELSFSVFVVFTLISYITYLYFNNNRVKFVLLRLNGVSFFKTYKEILFITTVQYLFLFALGLFNFSLDFLTIVSFFFITELSILSLTLFKMERQNKLNIMRGK